MIDWHEAGACLGRFAYFAFAAFVIVGAIVVATH